MDNKSRFLNQSKGLVASDGNKKLDFTNNKQQSRNGRRRDQPNYNKQDTSRPTNNKPKKNVEKYQLPRPRGIHNQNPLANGATGLTDESELNSVYSPGSKKQSLNHLLNFHYAPRDKNDAPNYTKVGNNKAVFRKPRYNKEQFLQANCQFVVRDGYGYDYSILLSAPDALVDWNQIEQINIRSSETTQCPICLFEPVAAKMTRCGHVYCWPCILHYLALSDKAWRKCPICFTSVYSADLKSAVSKPQTLYGVGDRITLCLMKKEKNTMQIEKVSVKELKQNRLTIIPHLFDDIEQRMHSKLVLAGRDEILHILERERLELQSQLMFDGLDCPESVFVEEALQILQEREKKLFELQMNEQPTTERPIFVEKPEEPESDEAVGGDAVAAIDKNEVIDEETDLTISDIDIVATANVSNTKYHYFYQAEDGQNLFLHSINSRLLQAMYGSLEQSPLKVTGKIVQKDCCSLSDDLRKRLRYLQHLPVSSQFEIVEIDMDKSWISMEVLDKFHGELLHRRKMRQRKNREENIRERHISEINDRQMGLSMAKSANIEIKSSQQFPMWDSPEEAVAWPDSFSSDLGAHGGYTASAESPNDCNNSFAKMLTAAPTTLWPTLPSSSSRQDNQYNHLRFDRKEQPVKNRLQSSESDIDDENSEFVRAPLFENNLSSAISEALEKVSLKGKNSTDPPSAGKKKKNKKKQILFSSGMAFNN